MIFTHVSLVQEGQCVLFYRYDRNLKGYMIAGLLISPTLKARIDFRAVWKYFVSEIVKTDNIYCSILLDIDNTIFKHYLSYYTTIDGIDIYKIDNYVKKQYSNYIKHIERANKRKKVTNQ